MLFLYGSPFGMPYIFPVLAACLAYPTWQRLEVYFANRQGQAKKGEETKVSIATPAPKVHTQPAQAEPLRSDSPFYNHRPAPIRPRPATSDKPTGEPANTAASEAASPSTPDPAHPSGLLEQSNEAPATTPAAMPAAQEPAGGPVNEPDSAAGDPPVEAALEMPPAPQGMGFLEKNEVTELLALVDDVLAALASTRKAPANSDLRDSVTRAIWDLGYYLSARRYEPNYELLFWRFLEFSGMNGNSTELFRVHLVALVQPDYKLDAVLDDLIRNFTDIRKFIATAEKRPQPLYESLLPKSLPALRKGNALIGELHGAHFSGRLIRVTQLAEFQQRQTTLSHTNILLPTLMSPEAGGLWVWLLTPIQAQLDDVVELESQVVKSPHRIYRIARDVLRGLLYLAGQGLHHGSLSPRALSFDAHTYATRLLFIDCAILGVAADAVDSYEYLSYTAPERLLQPDAPATEKSDVYSFGMLLWRLLNKVEPHDTKKFKQKDKGKSGPVDPVRYKKLLCRVTKTGDFNRPHISRTLLPAFVRLIEACWQPGPAARPSLAELLTAVEGWVAPVPPGTQVTELRSYPDPTALSLPLGLLPPELSRFGQTRHILDHPRLVERAVARLGRRSVARLAPAADVTLGQPGQPTPAEQDLAAVQAEAAALEERARAEAEVEEQARQAEAEAARAEARRVELEELEARRRETEARLLEEQRLTEVFPAAGTVLTLGQDFVTQALPPGKKYAKFQGTLSITYSDYYPKASTEEFVLFRYERLLQEFASVENDWRRVDRRYGLKSSEVQYRAGALVLVMSTYSAEEIQEQRDKLRQNRLARFESRFKRLDPKLKRESIAALLARGVVYPHTFWVLLYELAVIVDGLHARGRHLGPLTLDDISLNKSLELCWSQDQPGGKAPLTAATPEDCAADCVQLGRLMEAFYEAANQCSHVADGRRCPNLFGSEDLCGAYPQQPCSWRRQPCSWQPEGDQEHFIANEAETIAFLSDGSYPDIETLFEQCLDPSLGFFKPPIVGENVITQLKLLWDSAYQRRESVRPIVQPLPGTLAVPPLQSLWAQFLTHPEEAGAPGGQDLWQLLGFALLDLDPNSPIGASDLSPPVALKRLVQRRLEGEQPSAFQQGQFDALVFAAIAARFACHIELRSSFPCDPSFLCIGDRSTPAIHLQHINSPPYFVPVTEA